MRNLQKIKYILKIKKLIIEYGVYVESNFKSTNIFKIKD